MTAIHCNDILLSVVYAHVLESIYIYTEAKSGLSTRPTSKGNLNIVHLFD